MLVIFFYWRFNMSNDEKFKELFRDLSYKFATPEAEAFNKAINERKFNKAKKMIAKHLSDEDSTFIINQLRAKTEKKFKLVEISYNDFMRKYPYSNDAPHLSLVINYNGNIFSGCLYDNPRPLSSKIKDEWFVYFNNDFYKLKDVTQIWIRVDVDGE